MIHLSATYTSCGFCNPAVFSRIRRPSSRVTQSTGYASHEWFFYNKRPYYICIVFPSLWLGSFSNIPYKSYQPNTHASTYSSYAHVCWEGTELRNLWERRYHRRHSAMPWAPHGSIIWICQQMWRGSAGTEPLGFGLESNNSLEHSL